MKGKDVKNTLEAEDIEEVNKQMETVIGRKQEDKKAFIFLVIKKIGKIAGSND